jgi:hypothetical protein
MMKEAISTSILILAHSIIKILWEVKRIEEQIIRKNKLKEDQQRVVQLEK